MRQPDRGRECRDMRIVCEQRESASLYLFNHLKNTAKLR